MEFYLNDTKIFFADEWCLVCVHMATKSHTIISNTEKLIEVQLVEAMLSFTHAQNVQPNRNIIIISMKITRYELCPQHTSIARHIPLNTI